VPGQVGQTKWPPWDEHLTFTEMYAPRQSLVYFEAMHSLRSLTGRSSTIKTSPNMLVLRLQEVGVAIAAWKGALLLSRWGLVDVLGGLPLHSISLLHLTPL
jgi:hypothetical protein